VKLLDAQDVTDGLKKGQIGLFTRLQCGLGLLKNINYFVSFLFVKSVDRRTKFDAFLITN